MLRRPPAETSKLLPGDGPWADDVAALIADVPDDDLAAAIRSLGGHDLDALREAYGQIDDTRPTVIIAYTLKGYGLAIEGHPQNHSALLTEDQLKALALHLGIDPGDPWATFPPDSEPASLLAEAAARLARVPASAVAAPAVAGDLGGPPHGGGGAQGA